MLNSFDEKSKEAVLLIIKTAKDEFNKKLGRTEIMKLLYIAELAFLKKYGRTITGATYIYHHFGPFSQAILDVLDFLEKEGILKDEYIQDQESGYEKHNYILRKKFQIKYLNPDEQKFLEKVVCEFGNMTLRELLDLVCNMNSTAKAKKGDILIKGKGGE